MDVKLIYMNQSTKNSYDSEIYHLEQKFYELITNGESGNFCEGKIAS